MTLTINMICFEFARLEIKRLKSLMCRSLLMPALWQHFIHTLCGYKTLTLAATLCLEWNKLEKVAQSRQLCPQECGMKATMYRSLPSCTRVLCQWIYYVSLYTKCFSMSNKLFRCQVLPQWSITCQCQALPVLKCQVLTRWVSAPGLGRGRCLCGCQPCPAKYIQFKLYSNNKHKFPTCWEIQIPGETCWRKRFRFQWQWQNVAAHLDGLEDADGTCQVVESSASS